MVICLIILYEFMSQNTICTGTSMVCKTAILLLAAQSHRADLRAVDIY